jgi:hypothetical protein
MSIYAEVSDWRVAGLGSVEAGFGPGGGAWFFYFASEEADVRLGFSFVGGGIGVGGRGGAVDLPVGLDSVGFQFTSLDCNRPFSGLDLHRAGGRITGAGYGKGAGGAIAILTAWTWPYRPLFESQETAGANLSIGGSAISTVGLWSMARADLRHYRSTVLDAQRG